MAIQKVTTSKVKTQKQTDAANQKLADAPAPAAERAELGDWAKSNNPSPDEQTEATARNTAIHSLNQ